MPFTSPMWSRLTSLRGLKILVLTNLYPPQLADTDDFRCQNVTEALRARGHTVRVLTSNHGVATEQRDALVERRLHLNGVFGAELVKGFGDLQDLETHNNEVLREALASFAPEVVHVWSMRGISKSLLLTLRRAGRPTVFDVADNWMTEELRTDPWLAWWHAEQVSLPHKLHRLAIELWGERKKWDATMPTFIEPDVKRLPDVFDSDGTAQFKPNAIAAFQFRRLYFSSEALKSLTMQSGFRVSRGVVIHPGVDTNLFHGEVKPPGAPVKKFLVVVRLTPHCGVSTVIAALQLVRAQGAKATLSVFGRGSSEVLARLRTQAVQAELPVEFRTGGLQRDLPEIYRAHDAFIYPVEREEMFVSAPLEAMACGLPVIVNEDYGASDLFRSRESCHSFPSGDPGLLANRMLELIEQHEFRCKIAQTGQNEVLTRYQFPTSVDEIERYVADTVALGMGG